MAFIGIAAGLAACGGADRADAPPPGVAPAVTAQPANVSVDELQSATFKVTATGTPPLNYQWQRDNVPIAGATSATLTIQQAVPADSGARFSVVVSNPAGSIKSAEVTLAVRAFMPMFLLAGQSNMEGNPDPTLYQDLMDELARGTGPGIETRLVNVLRDWYLNANDGYASYGYSEAMAAFEARELVRLNAAGLAGANLNTPHPTVMCAQNSTPVAPLASDCGNPFGPELTLGHVLGRTAYAPTSLIKVAQGGTTLAADWRSPRSGGTVGPLYLQLRARMQSLRADPGSVHPSCVQRRCRWAAFVWFQGENDSFNSADAQAYRQNLENLIADVRADTGWPSLPVVIVQTGRWAQSLNYGDVVAQAQRTVVNADPRARLVTTSDLSGYYHYDPAAQLIIGERVAQAVQSLLASATGP